MKHLIRAAWISYFIFFLWSSLSRFIELVHPQSGACGFYYTLIAFHRVSVLWYICALGAAILSLITLWPLYVRAFALPRSAFTFFKFILALRIMADICGHNYETIFFKSIWIDNQTAAIAMLIIGAALYFPSYKALCDHAFNRNSAPPSKKA